MNRIPKEIGRLLIGDDYCDIYTLEEINELMLKLPQGIRRATEVKIDAYKEYQHRKSETKRIKNELRVATSKNWKEIYSSSKDRDAYVDSHEDVIRAEQQELDAMEIYMRAEALATQLENNFVALRKIYQVFADDDKHINQISEQAGGE
ncbi:MAG: hypothetical protein HUJ63_06845 [Enterococcus sp.]|nr:hypothetical protein [Enterococcus sp.]